MNHNDMKDTETNCQAVDGLLFELKRMSGTQTPFGDPPIVEVPHFFLTMSNCTLKLTVTGMLCSSTEV